MDPRYEIVRARAWDLPHLPPIELAAAALLRGHAPESVLSETTSDTEFRAAQAEGRLWVALAEDTPVGFALALCLEPGEVHLHEIDVHPDHGRRGLGARLVGAVCNWAALSGCSAVTLTTFRNVAWNMPFYARLGFREVPVNELNGVLAAAARDEARRGLDPALRVAMRRPTADLERFVA